MANAKKTSSGPKATKTTAKTRHVLWMNTGRREEVKAPKGWENHVVAWNKMPTDIDRA